MEREREEKILFHLHLHLAILVYITGSLFAKKIGTWNRVGAVGLIDKESEKGGMWRENNQNIFYTFIKLSNNKLSR